jgi:SNF2 family DNA or RNA helicase
MAGVVTWQALKVSLPPKTRDLYTRLATDLVVEVEDEEIEAVNAGVLRLRLRQITGGFTTSGKAIHTAKVEKLEAYLHHLLGQGESVLVYCNFSPEVAACVKAAERVGYRTYVVQGSTSKVDRARAFQAVSPASRLVGKTVATAVILQIQAGSRAVDLSGAAELVFFSVPDGWVDYWQALNRVRGPNQSRPVRITHILARASVDVADMQRLRRKEDAHATMMRNPKRYLGLI